MGSRQCRPLWANEQVFNVGCHCVFDVSDFASPQWLESRDAFFGLFVARFIAHVVVIPKNFKMQMTPEYVRISITPPGAKRLADSTVFTLSVSWSQSVASLKVNPIPRPSWRGMLMIIPSPNSESVFRARCNCSWHSHVKSPKLAQFHNPNRYAKTSWSCLNTGMSKSLLSSALTITEYFSHWSIYGKTVLPNFPCSVLSMPMALRSTA